MRTRYRLRQETWIFPMWKNATLVAACFFLAACADDQERLKEAAQALAQTEAQVEQQDDARCQSYGRPGSAAYLDCRTSLKNSRASMRK
jgi:outer membrane biogenesis lipoprotein LolB